MTGTVEAIRRELCVDGFVLRYDTHDADDGLPARRGRVPALLVLARRLPGADRAHTTRRTRCSTGSPGSPTTSGCSPRSTTRGSAGMVGNFPQAFTHVGLVNTAMNLDGAHHRSRGRAARGAAEAARG